MNCELLDDIVWSKVHNLLNQPEEMSAASVEESQENFWEMNKSRIERDIEKTRLARKKLIKLFSIDIGMGEDQIREELREIADRESGKNLIAETL